MKVEYYRDTPVLKEALGDFLIAGGKKPEDLPVYGPDPRFVVVPAGTVNCRSDCWLLARQGTAKPVDEECKMRVNMSPDQIVNRFERQRLLEAGKLTGDPKLDAPDDDEEA